MTVADPISRDLTNHWPEALFDALKAAGIRQMSYVPDAGHSTLIRLFDADPEVTSTVLTTEEGGRFGGRLAPTIPNFFVNSLLS